MINFAKRLSRAHQAGESANGVGADFAFQCTGAPRGGGDIYEYIARRQALRVGFFVNNGEYNVNRISLCATRRLRSSARGITARTIILPRWRSRQAREMKIIKELITLLPAG
ncbi:MAG: hypothetical protein ACLRSW_07160 [Christensenellaceae bacterium]